MTAPNFVVEYPNQPTANVVGMSHEILERMERAVLNVRERLLRSTAALQSAGIRYAVIGGNAVASWVSTKDTGAVRNTPDVDLLVRRQDLPEVTSALEAAGFVHGELLDVVMFRDGPEGKPSEAVHLLFSGEKVRPEHILPAPPIETIDDPENFKVIKLESLVEMKLLSNRRKDQVHLDDMIRLGLIDATWLPRFPPELRERLQYLLDTPQ
jgi:hypothetical protein